MQHVKLVSEGTSILGDDAIQRIASKMQDTQDKRTAKHNPHPPMVEEKIGKVASKNTTPTEQVKIASLHDIPSDFEKMGTGFYRRGHHLWELAPLSDGSFVLIRKRGEDHVLGYDPEPIVRETVAFDRRGVSIKIGSRVLLPHRGKVTAGTVIIVQPGSMGVELDSGEKIDTPPDICELLHEMVSTETSSVPEVEEHEGLESEEQEEHEAEEAESDIQACEEFEPMLEPSSKAGMSKAASKELLADPANLKEWQEHWRGMGQHVAESISKPKQTKEEAAMKRKQRRQQRTLERSGLPKGMKVPPKQPKTGAIDTDELAKLKERIRLYQQCFDEIEYVLQDESLRTDEVRLADEMDRVMEEYHEQIESMDEEREDSREDELSIEKPAETPVPTDAAPPLPKMSNKIVVTMQEL